jgi:hypothetical protein
MSQSTWQAPDILDTCQHHKLLLFELPSCTLED